MLTGFLDEDTRDVLRAVPGVGFQFVRPLFVAFPHLSHHRVVFFFGDAEELLAIAFSLKLVVS
jgi:hypothetical protein